MEEFEIILDGVYGLGLNYQDYVSDLAEANGKDIRHRMNTPGGDVAEATAMRNALEGYMKKYPDAKISFEVDGWVQSSATYHMAVSGATVSVNPDTLYMYHNPSSVAFGDHAAMEKQMNFLRDITNIYAQSYAARSGKSVKDTQAEMDAETYYIGQSIVDAGFADVVEGESDGAAMQAIPVVVEMGRKRFQEAVGMLAASAYGQAQIKTNPETVKNNKQETPTMSDKKENETQTPDVSGETARAEAWMAATEANPKLKTALSEKFKSGAGVEFFNGVVAAAEMTVASVSHEEATADDPGELTPAEPKKVVGQSSKTVGMTGEMAEV